MSTPETEAPIVFLDQAEVLRRTTLSRTEFYRRRKAGEFSPGVPVNPAKPQKLVWTEAEITAWQKRILAQAGAKA